MPDPFTSPRGHRAVSAFNEANAGWQAGVDPRQAFREYTERGSAAANVDLAGVSVRDVSRAKNYLFDGNEWGPAEERHYHDFAHGPLSAYLTRMHELDRGMSWRHPDLPPAKDVFDGSLPEMPHWSAPGAHQALHEGYARLIDDVRPALDHGARFELPEKASLGLEDHADALSRHMFGVPREQLSPEQQAGVLHGLDAYLQEHDPQAYVHKQMGDFYGGLDVPRAGAAYHGLSGPLEFVHDHALDIGGAVVARGLAQYLYERHKQRQEKQAMDVLPNIQASADGPKPRGDQMQPTLMSNPYTGPQATEYENGFQFVQGMPREKLMTLSSADVARWRSEPAPWRQGLAAAAKSLGRGDLADGVAKLARRELLLMKFAGWENLTEGGPGYAIGAGLAKMTDPSAYGEIPAEQRAWARARGRTVDVLAPIAGAILGGGAAYVNDFNDPLSWSTARDVGAGAGAGLTLGSLAVPTAYGFMKNRSMIEHVQDRRARALGQVAQNPDHMVPAPDAPDALAQKQARLRLYLS